MKNDKKILIIDDEADLLEVVGFQCEARGFKVAVARDGMEALAMVHEFEPDLIILDLNMPRMGGIEFYSRICDSHGHPMYPIMVLTARANVEKMFKDWDIDGFMIKPFEVDDLIMQAAHIIMRRQQKLTAKIKSNPLPISTKICIADHDRKIFDQLSLSLLHKQCTIIPAFSGAQAIEHMMKDVPHIAMVALGLSDLPGDTVILRLSQMARTMDIKFVLYTAKTVEHDQRVMDRISEKSGIYTFVQYNSLSELVSMLD